MGKGRGKRKWQGIAGIPPFPSFSNCESDLQDTAVQGRKGFCFLFFLKENVASASVLVVALVTHPLGSYSHAAASAEVNLTPEKISCFFTKLISRTKRKWEEEVGGLKRLSPPYGQLHKSTEGIVSRIIGWKKKKELFSKIEGTGGKGNRRRRGRKRLSGFLSVWFVWENVGGGGKKEKKKPRSFFFRECILSVSCFCSRSFALCSSSTPPLSVSPPPFQGLFDFFCLTLPQQNSNMYEGFRFAFYTKKTNKHGWFSSLTDCSSSSTMVVVENLPSTSLPWTSTDSGC